MFRTLLKNAKVVRLSSAVAAGSTDSDSSIIDTQGFGGVMFVAALGDVTATAVVGLIAQQNDANSGAGMESLPGVTPFTAGATDADNKLLVLDVVLPRKRYLRARVQRSVANAVIDGVFAVLYAPDQMPQTVVDATVLAQATQADPAPV